ncbi:hypothetical protein DF3PB_2270004 [uncultured Defluviicoccus sp.]|uniref:Uncharacterized protein n=1 Tax=metagenome TaxID=256318 RepID=A0A380TE87_9ZZZZ|nr:hypothetical protein DF3PB_2270004 [uncultured Defluviicoccus sp.]
MTEPRVHCAFPLAAAAAPLPRAVEAIDTAARALAGGVEAPADGEEGARMLALRTKLQLSATTHSLAAESRKSVLALLDPSS